MGTVIHLESANSGSARRKLPEDAPLNMRLSPTANTLANKQGRKTGKGTKPLKTSNHIFSKVGPLEGSIIDLEDGTMSLGEISRLMEQEPDPGSPATTEHLGGSRQYWRDIILGVNDGLVSIDHNMLQRVELSQLFSSTMRLSSPHQVSTFLLVAAVAGGRMTTLDILLTAIAGAVAGAISMCAGEYVATKSQNEVIHGEMKLEQKHIQMYPRDELRQVPMLLELIGITDENCQVQKQLVHHYARDRKALLKLMYTLELGYVESEERSPIRAGIVSLFLFLTGAVPSVLPFMVPDIDPTTGLIVAAVATSTALVLVGALKTWASKGNCLTAALENLSVAGFGGAIAYCTGLFTHYILNSD
jgi:vacuolar iron transporter family protein